MNIHFHYSFCVVIREEDLMAESLESLWSKLSFTESEQEEVTIDQEWVQETVAEGENCIIGKLLSSKGLIWKP